MAHSDIVAASKLDPTSTGGGNDTPHAQGPTDLRVADEERDGGKHVVVDEKQAHAGDVVQVYSGGGSDVSAYDARKEDHFGEAAVVSDAKDVVTHVLHVDDDPGLNPWTFRAFFLGIGLAIFSSSIQQLFYFKPQAVYVSIVFLTVIAYILGEAMSSIPRSAPLLPFLSPVLRLVNPQPFNSKEHTFIVITASAGATTAVATEIIAAQRLYYDVNPAPAAAVFLVMSSQLLAYGLAGLLRAVLVQPAKMLWPINIPVNSLLETLHRDRAETRVRVKWFTVVFFVMFFYEIIPEWIFPLLQGLSIFCLAKRDSLVFTNLFGGSQGNEGLGFLSLSFDWQWIAGLGSPMWVPLRTLVNNFIGYILCICLFMGIYYGNIWESQNFPFLSQLLFDPSSNSTNFVEYNLTAAITADYSINSTAIAEMGTPYITGTYISSILTSNMGMTAAIVHLLLWNYDDIKDGWAFLRPTNLRKLVDPAFWRFWEGGETKEEYRARILADPSKDPHYKLMVQNGIDEVPHWWYAAVLIIAFFLGLGTLYATQSTLPWWGYIIANMFAALFILFFGAQMGITGFQFNLQPILQMVAGYLHPGRPIANMYFTVFGYNGVGQGQWLLRDLKLAQFAHLSPRAAFTAQMMGTVVGAVFDYVVMQTIVTSQFDILRSIEGSNIWSGQNVQQYNTLAVAWSIAGDTFSVGARYQWVTLAYLVGFAAPLPLWLLHRWTGNEWFAYFDTSIILWYIGWLCVGTNASVLSYFLVGFAAQFYLRRYRPGWFVKWNYLVSAALDGGTQVIVFILSFAVFGASGSAHDFPTWAGNNGGIANGMNLDYCMFNTAAG